MTETPYRCLIKVGLAITASVLASTSAAQASITLQLYDKLVVFRSDGLDTVGVHINECQAESQLLWSEKSALRPFKTEPSGMEGTYPINEEGFSSGINKVMKKLDAWTKLSSQEKINAAPEASRPAIREALSKQCGSNSPTNELSSGAIDTKLHKLCIEAKDYQGCIRAMQSKGSISDTLRIIEQRGADIPEGNQCASGYGYRGGGLCQQVTCKDRGMWGVERHDPQLGGKDWRCKGPFYASGGSLQWGAATSRSFFNSSCPSGEPEIGFNSTCKKMNEL